MRNTLNTGDTIYTSDINVISNQYLSKKKNAYAPRKKCL